MPVPAAAEPRPARWQELTKAECFELLANEHLGRVAVVDDRGPVVFPVNFVLDRHTVVFRTEQGTKLQAAARGSRVCFEVDRADEGAHAGWSVIVRGEITEVTDRAELERLAVQRHRRPARAGGEQDPLQRLPGVHPVQRAVGGRGEQPGHAGGPV